MKICLAGTGAMGEIHVKALAKIEGVEVVSVAGRTPDGVAEFAGKWSIPFHSTDLAECMERPGVDAVILTTPSDQHCDQTLLALSKAAGGQSTNACFVPEAGRSSAGGRQGRRFRSHAGRRGDGGASGAARRLIG